jgi:hypothetical protein
MVYIRLLARSVTIVDKILGGFVGIGYCKYCRNHGVEVHRLERIMGENYPVLVWTNQGESIGMCEDCESSIPVTRDELLQAAVLWGKQSVHEMIGIEEYLSSLEDNKLYTAIELINLAPLAYQMSEDRCGSLRGLVMAASRVRESDGSPRDMKRAARSVFVPFFERGFMGTGMGKKSYSELEKEFGEKWVNY